MLDKFIEYESLDLDIEIIQYYDCKVLKPFGKFKRGDVVPVISWNFEKGIVQAWDGDTLIDSIKLELVEVSKES